MLALSLLLCAAGVKAMLGMEISSIQISDNQYFCPENCAFQGAYFGINQRVCALKELVVQLNTTGMANPDPRLKYNCAEAALTTRPREKGEEADHCRPKELDKSLPIDGQCSSFKFGDSKDNVEVRPVEQLSEVLKLLGLPASQEAQGCKEATDRAAQIEPRQRSL
ncbi:hypothetical protein H634G_09313 [Metarhizium anisopliae BRIP 53293]|uniref:Apple domain-containing protein n=1 Tax=Metarhizium anisopliae BRIP 53293 TaxID=1291518 RepID=A0A0D9NRP5_METAN|nr:hypothetical protein H634G_09313 [Metarhizium anisopliae BRIP 53293]KJK85330.1 hypothetical protein H633G_10827 [Metarhizium anisopliae BRIP 53284]